MRACWGRQRQVKCSRLARLRGRCHSSTRCPAADWGAWSFPCLASNVLSLPYPARGPIISRWGVSSRPMSAAAQACGILCHSLAPRLLSASSGGPSSRTSAAQNMRCHGSIRFSFLPSSIRTGLCLAPRLTHTSAAPRASKLRFLARHGNTNTSSAYAWIFCFVCFEASATALVGVCDSHFL